DVPDVDSVARVARARELDERRTGRAARVAVGEERPVRNAYHEIESAVAVEVAERRPRFVPGVHSVHRIAAARDRDERGGDRAARVPEIEEHAELLARDHV